jgi:amidase
MPEVAFLPATELAARIRARTISSVELLQHYLARIDRYNPTLNAIVVDIRDRALEDARAADAALARGDAHGPLHGVPMTFKESYDVAGTPTTWGFPAWRGNVAAEDAVAVQKMKAAGVVVFGKTNVPLMLADFQSYNDIYGTTLNPYDHSRTPGGSSGGSAAALAAGLTGLEAGSDIGGSIRNPAHFCGVFGHKPTWSLVWARGHTPPGDVRGASDIAVVGPLGRSAHDLEVSLVTTAGPDPIAARGYRLDLPTLENRKIADLRIAVWEDDELAPVSAEVRKRVNQVADALRAAGARVDHDARPTFGSAHSHETYQNLLQATMSARMPEADYQSLKSYVDALDPDDDSATARVFRAQVASFRMWKANDEQRAHLRWKWHEFFAPGGYDVLIAPIMPTSAFPHDHAAFGDRTIQVDNQDRPYFERCSGRVSLG